MPRFEAATTLIFVVPCARAHDERERTALEDAGGHARAPYNQYRCAALRNGFAERIVLEARLIADLAVRGLQALDATLFERIRYQNFHRCLPRKVTIAIDRHRSL